MWNVESAPQPSPLKSMTSLSCSSTTVSRKGRFTKAQMRNFFHTMKAQKSYYVSATAIIIENRKTVYETANWTLHDTRYVHYITAPAVRCRPMYTRYCRPLRIYQPGVTMNSETHKGKSCFVYKDNKFREYYGKKNGNVCFRCTLKTKTK